MKQKVLILEDDQDLLQVISHTLTRLGCEVRTATNANEARFLINREEFSDLLTDVNLPDTNGFDFVNTLVTAKPLKIWIMSGHVESEDPRIQNPNISGFFQKPFDSKKLKKMIR